MTKKKKDDKDLPAHPAQRQFPVQDLHPVRRCFESDETEVEGRKLVEIFELVHLPATLDGKERNARLVRAVDLFESLRPEDGVETMLATQMVGTHHAALECLRRANLPGSSSERRDLNLKQAIKLMGLYTQQVAALDKHRGKGQQKVTVEHVHVEAGGQAIVGNVDAAGMTDRSNSGRSNGTVQPSNGSAVDAVSVNGEKPSSESRPD